MAKRNEGKAQTMLNRWISIETQMISNSMGKRPKDIDSINNVQICNIWRNQVIKEIAKKVGDIQNASLGEALIRDLNDEINSLFEEKAQWEAKIKKISKTKEPTKARIKTESAERRKMNPNNSERNKKLSQKSINKAHYTEFYTEENKKSQKHFNANQTISNDKTKPKKIKEVKKDKTVQ